MASNNAVNNGLSGSTGTGSFVGGTAPTVTLPAINNALLGYTTTATAAGTTVLTVNSNYQQFFTGATTQTVTLPVTSTLVLGQSYLITNNSTGNVTVQSSGANTLVVVGPGTSALVVCILTSGTTAASWSTVYIQNSANIYSQFLLMGG